MKIPLTRGLHTEVSPEDFEWANQWPWFALSSRGAFYAARNSPPNSVTKKRHTILLHKEVANRAGLLPGEIDHWDRDELNNTRGNLRSATHSQQMMNRGLALSNTSGHKGVHFSKQKNKWQAYVAAQGVQRHLGYFESLEDAVKARASAAKQLFANFYNE